jgi:hypothetical protein
MAHFSNLEYILGYALCNKNICFFNLIFLSPVGRPLRKEWVPLFCLSNHRIFIPWENSNNEGDKTLGLTFYKGKLQVFLVLLFLTNFLKLL